MADSDVRRLAEEGRERGQLAVKLAAEAEALGQAWLDRIESQPPASEQEQTELREKSQEFRRLVAQRLDDLKKGCASAAAVVSTLDELAPDDRATVLAVQLAPILEGEAATARALAFLLEVCAAMENAS
jgi:hypothetical protein